jgi:NADH dehydrogenase/NADH:ubiquinone oxidoreductase subunit G
MTSLVGVGALTFRSYPFELRTWDVQTQQSLDVTDSFGASVRVYYFDNRVIAIEPESSTNTSHTWITDKGRQYFDCLFDANWDFPMKTKNPDISDAQLTRIFWLLSHQIYLYDHCKKQRNHNYFFTIVFENCSLEVLSQLLIVSHNYGFIQLRRAEDFKSNNDLEASYQLVVDEELRLSALCLLLSTNPRYEGYYLNLRLRQRFLKGNFKCVTLGPALDLTFPVSCLGSNPSGMEGILGGNHLICQDFKLTRKPILVFNSEMLKRNDGTSVAYLLQTLRCSNIISETWNGLNFLNPSLHETGNQNLASFRSVNSKDLIDSNSFYFLNTHTYNISNIKKTIKKKILKKTIKLKLLDSVVKKTSHQYVRKKLFLDHNCITNTNKEFFSNFAQTTAYHHLPSTIFLENQEETFLSTEGLYKRISKIVHRPYRRSSWQLLRRLTNYFKVPISFLDQTDSQALLFNSKQFIDFKNFMNFQFYAIRKLTQLGYYFSAQTQPFILYKRDMNFKLKTKKLVSSKLKYWLDDFYIGGKDEFSHRSLNLSVCSRVLRQETTNFF